MTKEQREHALARADAGEPLRSIAADLGCSHVAIVHLKRRRDRIKSQAQAERDRRLGEKVREALGECTVDHLAEIKLTDSQEACEAAWDIIDAIERALREEAGQ